MTTTALSPGALARAEQLSIGAFELADSHAWPGRLAAAVTLDVPGAEARFAWDELSWVLDDRRGLVDAVVFMGAEPTANAGLAAAMARVREFGYGVGLRTAGANPHALAEVLSLLDWVSIEIAGAGCATARTSLELIMRSGVDYEVTLTVDPATHSREDVFAVVREVIRAGAHAPVLCGRAMYEVINVADLPDLERR